MSGERWLRLIICDNCEYFWKESNTSEHGFCHVRKDRLENKFFMSACERFRRRVALRPPMSDAFTTTYNNSVSHNIDKQDVVIVYGDIKGNVKDCKNVIIINGNVMGNIKDCDNVCGLLSDKSFH